MALLQLAQPVALSDHAAPLCLPDLDFPADQTLAFVALLGRQRLGPAPGAGSPPAGSWWCSCPVADPGLPAAVTPEARRACGQPDNMFCAGHTDGSKDACKGDSGARTPTHFRGHLVPDRVSWGWGEGLRGGRPLWGLHEALPLHGLATAADGPPAAQAGLPPGPAAA